MEPNQGSVARYFSFRHLITTGIVRNIYLLGVVLITGVVTLVILAAIRDPSVVPLLASTSSWTVGGYGLLIFLAANIIWRLLCEAWILIFSVHDILAAIELRLQRQA